MAFRKRPDSHDGGGDRNLRPLGKFSQFLAGFRGNNTAARINDRPLALLEQTNHLVESDFVQLPVWRVAAQVDFIDK